jgi:hypothetical protein
MTRESHPEANLNEARRVLSDLYIEHKQAPKLLAHLREALDLLNPNNSCERCERFIKLKKCTPETSCKPLLKGTY